MQKTVTYIPGSCSFSQMQNIKKKEEEKRKRREGRGGHRGLVPFLCRLLAGSLQPSTYIMLKVVNKQITTAHERLQRSRTTSSGVSATATQEKEPVVFLSI